MLLWIFQQMVALAAQMDNIVFFFQDERLLDKAGSKIAEVSKVRIGKNKLNLI